MYKILYVNGYRVKDILNDNLDVFVAFENGKVFVGTMYTLLNIRSIMRHNNEIYFWGSDMIILEDLDRLTIQKAIKEMIKDGYFESAFSEAGTIAKIYEGKTFEDLTDMTI